MNPIVGIGELLWDVFPDGRKVAGGAPFNFAFHCQQLGHEAVIVSRVGADDLGRELREEVRRLGLTDAFIQTDYEHPTGTVRVTVDGHGQPAYTITDDVAWDYIGEEGPIDEGLAHDTAAVCFGTLAQRRPTSRSTIREFIGPGSHMPSALRVFDVNLRTPLTYPLGLLIDELTLESDWVKVNLGEWSELSRLRGESAINLVLQHWKAAPERNPIWLITSGEEGVRWFSPTGEGQLDGVPVEVVDTVGAGDAFTAAMVCLHLEGRPLAECARFASHYAARVCEHRGGTPVIDRSEVERAARMAP